MSELFTEVFNWLPLAHCIEGRILVGVGGLDVGGLLERWVGVGGLGVGGWLGRWVGGWVWSM